MSEVLPLRNQTLMDWTGKQGDAMPAYLITKVLASHTDPGGADGSQDTDIQVDSLRHTSDSGITLGIQNLMS